jgi:hypothetical protein
MKKILATLSVGTLMVLAAPGIANAKGPGVTAKGKCSAASSSQIKIKTDNGRIDTEFEVDQNRVGQKWNVAIIDNGVVVARTAATTTAPSGSFTVHRLIPNRAGTNRVTGFAKNVATGETCAATASL